MSRFYYYAASVWPRYGDTLVTFVALKPGLAEEAAAKAAEFEVNERWQREMADFFLQPDGALPDRA